MNRFYAFCKQILTVLFLTIIVTPLFAELSSLEIEGKPEKSSDEIVGVKDANGRFCAAVQVISDMEGFSYDSYNGVVRVDKKPGMDMVYLQPDERVLQIFKTGYEPMKIILSEIGIKLNSNEVWKIRITGEKKLTEIPVSIITEPDGVEKTIDGKSSGTGRSFMLSVGKHTIKLQKDGYKSITEEIIVSETSALFEYNLQEVEQQLVTVKSIPIEAQIFIDDIEVGRTNKQIFRYAGQYQLKLTKSKYETIDEVITVTEGGNNTFSYTLIKTTAILTITTNPSDAEIYLNSEKKTSKTLEVSPGRHKIEIKKNGYFSEARTITVEKGKDLTETFTLKQKTGNLQVVVEPMETKVVLKRGNEQIDSWTGSKMIKDLPVGEHTLSCSAQRYKSQQKIIVVKSNQVTNIEIVMEEGSDIPASMIFVEGGTFTMGDTWNDKSADDDEKPTHKVTLSSFYIGKYEVTQQEWREVMGNNPSKFKGDDLPVEQVSWYDAVEFCNKKSIKEGLMLCYTINKNKKDKNNKSDIDKLKWVVTCNFNANGYRLPTEAEWEYTARGGNKSPGYKYSGSDNIKEVAWYNYNSNKNTHSVGSRKPNELGVYDMSGNVYEWCWDWYGKYSSSSARDPKGSSSGKRRILRGGSWLFEDRSCHIAFRDYFFPDSRNYISGFRVVVSFSSVKKK